MKHAIYALVALAMLGLTQPALGSITVHFVQEGLNVRVSFSGSLAVDATLVVDTSTGGVADGGVNGLTAVAVGESFYEDSNPGAFTITSLTGGKPDTITTGAGIGFTGNSLWYLATKVSGGAIGAVTELTADPTVDSMLYNATTLAAMNADAGSIAEGATLWTATTTGDTFIFSRTTPVPEPSEVVFVAGIGLIGFGLVRLKMVRACGERRESV